MLADICLQGTDGDAAVPLRQHHAIDDATGKGESLFGTSHPPMLPSEATPTEK